MPTPSPPTPPPAKSGMLCGNCFEDRWAHTAYRFGKALCPDESGRYFKLLGAD